MMKNLKLKPFLMSDPFYSVSFYFKAEQSISALKSCVKTMSAVSPEWKDTSKPNSLNPYLPSELLHVMRNIVNQTSTRQLFPSLCGNNNIIINLKHVKLKSAHFTTLACRAERACIVLWWPWTLMIGGCQPMRLCWSWGQSPLKVNIPECSATCLFPGSYVNREKSGGSDSSVRTYTQAQNEHKNHLPSAISSSDWRFLHAVKWCSIPSIII